MKLLFDQNVSFRILKKIEDQYPGSQQVKKIGLDHASDIKIWEYARKHDLTIVTFDSDFADISNLKGHPPKIIWLRCDIQTTAHIAELLVARYETISDFISNPKYEAWACLELKS